MCTPLFLYPNRSCWFLKGEHRQESYMWEKNPHVKECNQRTGSSLNLLLSCTVYICIPNCVHHRHRISLQIRLVEFSALLSTLSITPRPTDRWLETSSSKKLPQSHEKSVSSETLTAAISLRRRLNCAKLWKLFTAHLMSNALKLVYISNQIGVTHSLH